MNHKKEPSTLTSVQAQNKEPNTKTSSQSSEYKGRNMVYPGPIDPYFLAVILIPEPHFPPNFDPWALIKNWSHPCFYTKF